MPIFMLPCGKDKDSMICETAFKTLHAKFKTKNDDLTYREAKDGVFSIQPDGTERRVKDVEIWIDPTLGFGLEDIPDDWSFGNGTTVGSLSLKDEREIMCAWIVVSDDIKDLIKTNIEKIKKIFV